MKKLALSIAIVLGMTIGATAQYSTRNAGAGLFQRGIVSEEEMMYLDRETSGPIMPVLPQVFGETDDQGATPVGSGIAVLVGLGAAYAFAKKRREE